MRLNETSNGITGVTGEQTPVHYTTMQQTLTLLSYVEILEVATKRWPRNEEFAAESLPIQLVVIGATAGSVLKGEVVETTVTWALEKPSGSKWNAVLLSPDLPVYKSLTGLTPPPNGFQGVFSTTSSTVVPNRDRSKVTLGSYLAQLTQLASENPKATVLIQISKHDINAVTSVLIGLHSVTHQYASNSFIRLPYSVRDPSLPAPTTPTSSIPSTTVFSGQFEKVLQLVYDSSTSTKQLADKLGSVFPFMMNLHLILPDGEGGIMISAARFLQDYPGIHQSAHPLLIDNDMFLTLFTKEEHSSGPSGLLNVVIWKPVPVLSHPRLAEGISLPPGYTPSAVFKHFFARGSTLVNHQLIKTIIHFATAASALEASANPSASLSVDTTPADPVLPPVPLYH